MLVSFKKTCRKVFHPNAFLDISQKEAYISKFSFERVPFLEFGGARCQYNMLKVDRKRDEVRLKVALRTSEDDQRMSVGGGASKASCTTTIWNSIEHSETLLFAKHRGSPHVYVFMCAS